MMYVLGAWLLQKLPCTFLETVMIFLVFGLILLSMMFGVLFLAWAYMHGLILILSGGLAPVITSKVRIIENDLSRIFPVFMEYSPHGFSVSWVSPSDHSFKVNVDGSFRRSSGMAACYGLIHNFTCSLIKGFYCNLV